jgi:uncharacterized membrane protein YvbJ
MYCEKCGVTVSEGRDYCLNCGARVYQSPSTYVPNTNVSYGYSALQQQELQRKMYRMVGIVLIVIGIVLIPVAIFTFFMPIGWIFFPTAFICLVAGIITFATNQSIERHL